MRRKFFTAVLFLVCGAVFSRNNVSAQDASKPNPSDPASLIGTTLADLISAYGSPKQVYPVRGIDVWQDDVVFVYDYADFFISGNRVWQLKLRSAYGVKEGDAKAQVRLGLNQEQVFNDYSLYRLPVKVWPVMLRINWDTAQKVSGIFVYRSDF